MFAPTTSIVLAASLFAAQVYADVLPNEPSPSTPPFPEGGDCTFAWTGDTNATTQAIWKSMNVQLMTGSNQVMNHITTVATNLDGTVTGNFKYPCPKVKPNAAVYFYQFTSATSKIPMWTTRFTIAAADGTVEDAPNPTQPDGAAIPWGIGALEDPSTAVAPPTNQPGGGPAAPGSSSSSPAVAGSTAPGTVGATTLIPSTTPRVSPSANPSASVSRPAPSASQSGTGNSAVGALRIDGSLYKSLAVLGACAMTFAVLL